MERLLKIRKQGDGRTIVEDSHYAESDYRSFAPSERPLLEEHINQKLTEMFPPEEDGFQTSTVAGEIKSGDPQPGPSTAIEGPTGTEPEAA